MSHPRTTTFLFLLTLQVMMIEMTLNPRQFSPVLGPVK